MKKELILDGIREIDLDASKEKANAPKLFSTPRPAKHLIEINNLDKSFSKGKKKTHALKDVSLKINQNENMALLGANGAGKTTLIEIVVGANKQDSGTVKYNYHYVNNFQEEIGIQFQDSSYPWSLRVRSIVNFMVSVYDIGITKETLKRMVKMFGLEKFWNRQARSLSGGQQQRLNILLALLHKPKIVFLDELSTGLDISVREQIKAFVKEYCKVNGINIVLVSHDVNEIDQLCDRIVIMQLGEIKVDMYKDEVIKKFGSIEKLLNQYI